MENKEIECGKISFEDLKGFINSDTSISLSEDSNQKVIDSHNVLNELIEAGGVYYGINTGFGKLANTRIEPNDMQQLQHNIILSHATGVGEHLPDRIVKLILLLKINCLGQGYSGVTPELLDALMGLYNHQVYPLIPAKGSVGASGDLAPLAHMSLPLIAVGDVRYFDKIIPAKKGLSKAKVKPLNLKPKEGLSLVNGTQVTNAILLESLWQVENCFYHGLISGALSLEALNGSHIPYHESIHQVSNHQSQVDVARCLMALLEGSPIQSVKDANPRVQDPYSIRCQGQVMGAVLSQMRYVKDVAMNQANGVSDNPLIFSDEGVIRTGGNFHAQLLGFASDNLALSICEIGSLAERRIAQLISSTDGLLPPFLVKGSGLNSGFMMAHVTASALVSENKALAHPHSVDSIPTSANQEDHVSMATAASYRLLNMADNLKHIIALELLASTFAISHQRPQKTSPLLESLLDSMAKNIRPLDEDRLLQEDIRWVTEQMDDKSLIQSLTPVFNHVKL